MGIDKVAALRATVLFGSLTNEELRDLASLCTEHKLSREEVLFTKVSGVHRENHPKLFQIQDQFGKLRRGARASHVERRKRALSLYSSKSA